jgi:hypothetical protein
LVRVVVLINILIELITLWNIPKVAKICNTIDCDDDIFLLPYYLKIENEFPTIITNRLL